MDLTGRGRSNNKNGRNRVSLIEDEEQEEKDPLMEDGYGGDRDDELEADGEMSENEQGEEEWSEGRRTRPFVQEEAEAADKEHYYGFSPAPNRSNRRQPMMGVNVTTLSGEGFELCNNGLIFWK